MRYSDDILDIDVKMALTRSNITASWMGHPDVVTCYTSSLGAEHPDAIQIKKGICKQPYKCLRKHFYQDSGGLRQTVFQKRGGSQWNPHQMLNVIVAFL